MVVWEERRRGLERRQGLLRQLFGANTDPNMGDARVLAEEVASLEGRHNFEVPFFVPLSHALTLSWPRRPLRKVKRKHRRVPTPQAPHGRYGSPVSGLLRHRRSTPSN